MNKRIKQLQAKQLQNTKELELTSQYEDTAIVDEMERIYQRKVEELYTSQQVLHYLEMYSIYRKHT